MPLALAMFSLAAGAVPSAGLVARFASAGTALLVPGIAALIGQTFAMAGSVGAICPAHQQHPKPRTSLGADLLATLVIAPLVGFLIGEIIASTGSNNSGPALGIGVTALALVGAFGAPMGGDLSLPPPSHPAAPTACTLGVPLLRLSFN
jgi:hypothetical protein